VIIIKYNDIKSNCVKKKNSKIEDDVIIELNDVSKIYIMGDLKLYALRNINLKINKGDFVIIIGPSGSGKSTLMNLVGCLDLPSTGTIKLSSEDISKLTESRLAKLRGVKIGFIFQQFNLIPTLSTLKNVMLPLEFQNVSLSIAEKRAMDLLNMVDLNDRLHHLPRELSGGQQQRVAIARALVGDPEILLADEPTGNLDTKTGKYILDFLCSFNKKGKTIIMVTHDLDLVKYGDKIVYIKDGKIDNIKIK
jgi:putative ABC transport system ATP-binding protein